MKKIISQNSALVTERSFFSQPFIPHHISILLKLKHGCKGICNMINVQEVENKYKIIWNKDLTLNIDYSTWKSVFKQIFYNIQDNSLIWFQYRLTHRILGTKDLLCKMSLEDSNICGICHSETESLMHLFVHCSHVVNLWTSFESWIYSSTCKRLIFSQDDIILGYLHKDNNYYPANTIIAVTKSHIFSGVVHGAIPNINALKHKLQKQFEDQHRLNMEMNRADKFNCQWLYLYNFLYPVIS